MENQIGKINPTEYGLQESEVTVIEQAFMPKIVERDALKSVYEGLLTKELTPELCKEAKEIRLKLVKVRTGIADIHKTQKAFYLAAGRFVDAWKNKETTPIEQMEENLKSIETHYERIEAERITKLESERKEMVLKFTEFPAANLALMTDDVFNAYLKGVELAYNAKIEEERKAEADRIAKEERKQKHIQREFEVRDFGRFFDWDSSHEETTDEEFAMLVEKAKEAQKKDIDEKEAQRKENERLKAEAEAKEKQLAIEREKAEAERKAIEEKARKEREENERKLKAEQEAARLAAENAAKERARLEYEIKQKEAAEEKARKEAELKAIAEQKAKEAAAAAPDREKIIAAVNSIKFELPECKSDQMQAVANTINQKFESFKKWAIDQTNNL